MKFRELGPKGDPMHQVIHVEFSSQYDMAMTFVRMQEWYESPKFHHKLFTLEEFMRWYSKEYGKGAFTYPRDWSGFNVPSSAVEAVLNGMGPYSDAETALFGALECSNLLQPPDPWDKRKDWDKWKAFKPFYLIATQEGATPSTIAHEAAHGRLFVSPNYRREVLRAVRQHDTSLLGTKLLKMGYSKWTLNDEIHAYALTGWPKNFKPNASLVALRKKLLDVVIDLKTPYN